MPEEPRTTPTRNAGTSRRLPLVIGGVVVAALVVVGALIALGGDGEGGAAGSAGSGGSGGASSAGTVGTDSTSTDNDLGPGIGVTTLPEPMPIDVPEEVSLLGSNDEEAAEAARAFFAQNGVDLTGVDVLVLPVADVGESLLVLDADMETLMALGEGSDDGDGSFADLQQLSAFETANVTRLVMNMRGTDDEGAFVFTLTLPIGALDPDNPAYADLTEEETLAMLGMQIRR